MANETRGTRSSISLILVIILVLVLAWLGWDVLFRGQPVVLPYTIISTDDISTRVESRGLINIRVQSLTPSLRELRSTALEIRETEGSEWDILTVFYYLPGMDISETAYAVARFNTSGLETIRLIEAEPAGTTEKDAESL